MTSWESEGLAVEGDARREAAARIDAIRMMGVLFAIRPADGNGDVVARLKGAGLKIERLDCAKSSGG